MSVVKFPEQPPRLRKYRPHPKREHYAWAEKQDTLCWHLCGLYLLEPRFTRGCSQCPSWDVDEHYGKVKRGCRAMAEEVIAHVRDAEEAQ